MFIKVLFMCLLLIAHVHMVAALTRSIWPQISNIKLSIMLGSFNILCMLEYICNMGNNKNQLVAWTSKVCITCYKKINQVWHECTMIIRFQNGKKKKKDGQNWKWGHCRSYKLCYLLGIMYFQEWWPKLNQYDANFL
jgi:hypothetical protein